MTDNTPEIFQHIKDLHEQVREFVEGQGLGFKVTHIEGSTETQYAPKRTKDGKASTKEVIDLLMNPYQEMTSTSELTLMHVKIAFRVRARNGLNELSTLIYVASDGTFHEQDTQIR